MALFESYASESAFDELFEDEINVREYWKEAYEAIKKAGIEELTLKQNDIDWHLEDNGVTYNLYDSKDGNTKRKWSLDPIPFVLCEEEWEDVKKGLEQRAKLLNLVLKDLYGEQRLIKENIVPAEVLFGHKGFATEVFNLGYKENFKLYYYAADMARGPDGKMWIINDKTQAPSGLGYAIENRLTMNSISDELYPNISIKKLSFFVEEVKELMKKLSSDDLSQAALFTPGPLNETYFEHAYLSSFLELNLVQGDDLLFKDGALWMKSLRGLKPIKTLIRRVDDRFCDPLELKSSSRLGVAGLVEAMRQESITMLNPVGSAILENKGLNPFMPKIAEFFLQEELLLPQIATWWCGQEAELEFVLENLHRLVIKKIDKTQTIQTYFGKKLSKDALSALAKLLQESPHKYIAQEEISFSTTPFYGNGKIEPRNAVIRTFAVAKESDYYVMNGGLVRVSAQKDTLLVSSQEGGTSKDLWILSKEKEIAQPYNLFLSTQKDTSMQNLPTLKAENLFWLGRYLCRSIDTARYCTYILKKRSNMNRYEVDASNQIQEMLQKALTHLTMTYPGFLDESMSGANSLKITQEFLSILKDKTRLGSLAYTMSMLSYAHLHLKELLAIESSKLFDTMQHSWNLFAQNPSKSHIVMANELDKLLIYLMAYKELVKESMFKEQGLVLYDIGLKIESVVTFLSKLRSLLCLEVEKTLQSELLEALLVSMEGLNAYRAHYKGTLVLENVLELLIFNKKFPKSLAYITAKLIREFKELPKAKESVASYEEPIYKAKALLDSKKVADILVLDAQTSSVYVALDTIASTLSNYFTECSNEFTKTYFSHSDE